MPLLMTAGLVAEQSSLYPRPPQQWILVLIDCPGIQGLYTYAIPSNLTIQVGDILSVPFGSHLVGGIAIAFTTDLPIDLTVEQIKTVEEIIVQGFFTVEFWQLLHRVADYYAADLLDVIRAALPPGILSKSQRRIRLNREQIPPGAELFCSASGQIIFQYLQASKSGDYSYRHLQQKFRTKVASGVRDLLKRGWVESYLEAPKYARPQQKKAVTLLATSSHLELTEKQQQVLTSLQHQGGECWLSELTKLAHCAESVIVKLAEKGYVNIEYQECLRLLAQPDINRDGQRLLTPDQKIALDYLQRLQGFHQVLLHGVTGSGKTEVYLQAIAPILSQGKSILVLVPEIGLTPQLTDRFRARFGNKIVVYHSALSEGERYDTWRQMFNHPGQIVIGTRSAVFAPLINLGLIILDEEHDSSFKQSQKSPYYHARTVAQWRAELEDCPLILGSATPSLETWIQTDPSQPSKNAQTHYLSLPERVQSRPLPPITLVDMRQELKTGNRSIFSRTLQTALKQLQPQHQRAILFISHRGHSTFVSCRSCGYVLECPHCDVSLSYHYTQEDAQQLLRCHYCNYSQAHPRHCPDCHSPYLKFFGSGTQKVTASLTAEFPELRWLRFDSDTTRQKGEHRRLLERFRQGEADILVGTQMLTKGLDIESVTLVGVIAADSLLHFADYRSAERTFQTLTQVAGRAGRGDDPGQVIIQTYSPHHPVIQAVQTHNYHRFIEQELPQRRGLNYPPYGRLVLIRLSSLEPESVEKSAIAIAADCQQQLGAMAEILGPAPATIMRVAQRYRWQIVIKFPSQSQRYPDFRYLQQYCPTGVSFSIDVDPLFIE
jgi:primosomal protein N' (replication factor Y)